MKFLKRLSHNWGLKIASIVGATILWFLVTNINDPVIQVRFSNIAVTLKNTDVVTSAGDVYQVVDNTDVVPIVTITAPRSIAESFTRDNIIATADFNDLTSRNTVSISLSVNKYSNEIDNITGSVDTLKLDVEKKATATLPITASTSGTVSDDCIVGDVTTEQNMLRITGPESVVNSIDHASVDVDVTGFTSNISTIADIHLYDEDGDEISDSSLTLNIKSVRVNVEILQTKLVNITYVTTGTPADNYMLTGVIESTPSAVLLAGRSSTLSSINELEISGDSLDVTGLTSNLETTFDITSYLPTGVKLGDSDFNGIVSVVVYIEPEEVKEVEVPLRQFTLENVPEGYDAEIRAVNGSEDDSITMTITGLSEDVSTTAISQISGTVDVSELVDADSEDSLSGTYQAEAKITLPGGVSLGEDVTVQVILRGTEEEENSSSED